MIAHTDHWDHVRQQLDEEAAKIAERRRPASARAILLARAVKVKRRPRRVSDVTQPRRVTITTLSTKRGGPFRRGSKRS